MADDPTMPELGPRDWLRVLRRALPLAIVVFGCLAILLVVRMVEYPIYGPRRPITPRITQFVCKSAFVILGISHRVHGTPMADQGAAVANHVSWLDIFALNAHDRIYFIAKAEVAGWPGIGWLARATGTMFVIRNRAQAVGQTAVLQDRLTQGHRLLFFPEGTSTDGQRVLPFKPTLFQAFWADGLRNHTQIQPISVIYTAPKGQEARYYGWWGDMEFGAHLLKVLATRHQGAITVRYHTPVAVADYPNRKALAQGLEQIVRRGLAAG
ncbi:MAG: lysophospholipid acyltransferase family protein [Pseudomonadota bacterium]